MSEDSNVGKYAPIFEKDGNEFLLIYKEYTADDEDDAYMIGFCASLETVTMGAKFTGKTFKIYDNIPSVKAYLADFHVAVISGPIFDRATAKEEET